MLNPCKLLLKLFQTSNTKFCMNSLNGRQEVKIQSIKKKMYFPLEIKLKTTISHKMLTVENRNWNSEIVFWKQIERLEHVTTFLVLVEPIYVNCCVRNLHSSFYKINSTLGGRMNIWQCTWVIFAVWKINFKKIKGTPLFNTSWSKYM